MARRLQASGQILLPGIVLLTIAPLPAMSFGQSTDSIGELSPIEQSLTYHRVGVKDFELLSRVIARRPNDVFARYLLARCYEQTGYSGFCADQDQKAAGSIDDPQGTLRLFQRHVEEGDSALAKPMSSLMYAHFPTNPYLRFLNGIFYEEKQNYKEALPIYNELLTRSDCPLGVATRVAAVEIKNGNYARANELTAKDLGKKQDYFPALICRAHALLFSGRPEEAAKLLLPHLDAHPFDRRLSVSLYKILCRIGHYEEALMCALRNISAAKTDDLPEAYERVERMLKMLPRKQSKQVIAQTAARIDVSEYAPMFHYRLGNAMLHIRRPADALEQFNLALEFNHEYEPPVSKIGMIMQRSWRDYDKALNQYEIARKMVNGDSDNNDVMYRLQTRLRNRKRDTAWKLQDAASRSLGRTMKESKIEEPVMPRF